MTPRRVVGLLLVLGLFASSCKPAGTPASTTTTRPPQSTTTTTRPPATTTTTVNTSADDSAAIEEAKKSMGAPDLIEGGTLNENGSFDQTSSDTNPFDGVVILFFTNEDGRLTFYVEGPEELVRGLWIEFDAINSSGAVTRDASYLGDQVTGPPWAATATNGTVANASDDPPPEVAPGERLAALIPTEISTLEEFAQISIWLYSGLESGFYDFAHYNLLYEKVLQNATDGVVAAAFFSGLLTPGGTNLTLAWAIVQAASPS